MEPYYTELATAFVRGRLADPAATIAQGRAAGLRLHKFKAGPLLPRVQRVLGILRGLAPTNLLDIGSGRGTFLWPLLDALPHLPVAAIELSERRAADLAAVRRGGIARLTPLRMDAQALAFAPRSFDVVTLLETLEHMPHPGAALCEAVRVARRSVIVTVPSVPDDNPEHLHLFSVDDLQRLAAAAGAARTVVEHVLNHRVAILRAEP